MDRKFANHPGWNRILQNRFMSQYLETTQFTGYVSLFCMDRVRDPLFVEYFHQRVCIADNGYAWLKQFPTGEHYCVTTQYDADFHILAWYIDICLQTGVADGRVPWFDDLYLDLIVSPMMEIEIKDADELLAARDAGDITQESFNLAWSVAKQLRERIAGGRFELLGLCDLHLRELLSV